MSDTIKSVILLAAVFIGLPFLILCAPAVQRLTLFTSHIMMAAIPRRLQNPSPRWSRG